MAYVYKIPSDTKQAEAVVANMVLQGKSKRNHQSIKWAIAQYYMMGIREFDSLNYNEGTVSIAYKNEAGILKFRYEEIIAKYMGQLGRLLSLDLKPAVRKKGISLDGLRKASVAQVVMDAAFSQDKVSKAELATMPPLLMYGTVGLGLWIEGPDSQGIDIIPPWELLSIPVDVAGPNDVRGIMRIRYVPLDWVKNLSITPDKGSKKYKGLADMDLPSGQMPIDIGSLGDGSVSYTGAGGGFFIQARTKDEDGMASGKFGKKKKDEMNVPITQLVEVWTETSDGYLAEYAIYAGMTELRELYRHDHTAQKYYMPVQIIRDVTVGSFWGRSYIDQLIPLNNELEIALSSIFQAVSDFDLYGLQLWPATLGTPPLAQRGQDGIKRIVFEPDYTSPELTIENVMPAKMTAPMLQAVQLAANLLDRQANQPEAIMKGDAPGRVDSGAGLGFLYEASGIPISPTAKNIAEAYAGIYRALLRILKDSWTDQKVVSISNLDDSLAGIVLDAEAGTMSLAQNAIPFSDEVLVTIASEVPVSPEQQKVELKEAFKEGRITLDEFNWKVREQGLDIPVGDEVGWQNRRRAKMENIILFGDGKTPPQNKIIVGPHDLHRVHIMTLQAFMGRPEYYASSAEVRQKFDDHLMHHKAEMGEYPEQLEQPEDAAMDMMQPPGGGEMPIQ